MDDVEEALCFIMTRVSEYNYYDSEHKKKSDHDYLYIIIPNFYVTKLIGQSKLHIPTYYNFKYSEGCMVRQIAGQSGGSQIKILSDKNKESEEKECGIRIGGTLQNKQDAACKILEYIEIFKNVSKLSHLSKKSNPVC